MKKNEYILTVLLLFLTLSGLSAQNHKKAGISTNTLCDILLSPDLSIEYYSGKNITLSIGGNYGWWGFGWDKKNAFQQWQINAEARYYFKKDYSFIGHHIGPGVQSGQFDFKHKEDAKRGQFTTAGLLYGYTWKLSDHFYLDAGVGVGYIYSFYHKYAYSPENDRYCCTNHPTKHLIGLTNLNLSIIYRFKGGGKQ